MLYKLVASSLEKKAIDLFFSSIKHQVEPAAEQLSNDYKNTRQELLRTIFNARKITHNGIDISFDLADKQVLRAPQDFAQVLYFSPHNDDTGWALNFLNAISKTTPATVVLFSTDFSGVLIENTARVLQTAEEANLPVLPLLNNADTLHQYMSNLRYREYQSSCELLHLINNHWINNYSCLDPVTIITDNNNKMYSYLSHFRELSTQEKQYIELQIKMYLQESHPSKDHKTLFMIPFLWDYHQAHQDVSSLILSVYANLAPAFKENIEIWMYPTGDILDHFNTNRYFPFPDDGLIIAFWNLFTTQIERVPSYPKTSKEISLLNAAQIKSRLPFAEKFLKVNIL